MKSSIRNILLLMAFGTLSACSEQTVTVSYQEYPNAFRNPMKGFREFFAPGIDRVREEYPYPYGSLTKEYMQWNMIEDDANDGVDKIIAYSNHRWKGVEKILGDAFAKAFKNKKVMVRYAYEFKDYEFGIYWDSWSQPQEIVRGYEEMKKLGDRWKTQPIGGEITWNWGDLARFKSFEEVVADKDTREYVMEQIRNLHCNHLGGITWADFNEPEFRKNAEILQKAMGYRFIINEFSYPKEIKVGAQFPISFKVVNSGSSPFYYNWPVEVALLDPESHQKVWGKILEEVNISEWMPGDNWSVDEHKYQIAPPTYHIRKNISIDAPIAKGKYILALTVLDPAGMQPSLRFANENYFEGGYHPMGYIGIGESVADTRLNPDLFFDIQSDKSLKYQFKQPDK